MKNKSTIYPKKTKTKQKKTVYIKRIVAITFRISTNFENIYIYKTTKKKHLKNIYTHDLINTIPSSLPVNDPDNVSQPMHLYGPSYFPGDLLWSCAIKSECLFVYQLKPVSLVEATAELNMHVNGSFCWLISIYVMRKVEKPFSARHSNRASTNEH